jgi:iron complex outermembrane receptor protein
MSKFTRLAVLVVSIASATTAIHAQTNGDSKEKKPDENIVVMEKFVANDNDPSGLIPKISDSVFGLGKPIVDTPRSISIVSGDMVDKFHINELVDMASFVPSTYTSFSFGIQGGLNIRGGAGDTYYREMKRINNGPNMPTLIGASDGVDIVRGPPSAVYGAGQVGGYTDYKPKSARASTGRYMDSITGKVTMTLGSYGKKTYTGEVGGPLSVFGKRAGFYAYAQVDDSGSYYYGSFTRQQIVQATLTVDLTSSLRLETGINYQNFHGTGISGWNRITQDLVSNRNYQAGLPLVNLDTNGDGLVSLAEFVNAKQNFTIVVPATGIIPKLTNASILAMDPATTAIVKLSPRAVAIEKNGFGRDDIFFADLVNDSNPNLVFRNKLFVEKQAHHKASDIAYFRMHHAFLAEDRVSVEWHASHLPDWLRVADVTSANARWLDTYNITTNVDQIFNYWDLSRYQTGHYNFADGYDNPELAPIASAVKSQDIEAGLGTLFDITAFKKLDLTVGERLDTVYARVGTRQGYTLAANDTVSITPARFDKGSDKKYSLTSASVSYEIFKGIRPYFTYGKPRSFIPGSSGGLTSTTLTSIEILQPSQLKEAGIKGDFLGGKLFVGTSAFDQFRGSYNTTLNEYQNTESKGADIEARWVPSRRISISASIDWIQKITTPPSAAGTVVSTAVAGFNPITQGLGRYSITVPAAQNDKSFEPPQVWNLFANMDVGKGFDVSVGLNRQGSFDMDSSRTIHMPSALLVTASVGYTTRKWDFRISGKNLTDALYYAVNSGNLIPGVGRAIDCKFTWKFGRNGF